MTDRIKKMTPTAARLACAVADMDIRESHVILGRLTRGELQTLAVILAASVDLERPLGESIPEPVSDTHAAIRRIAHITAAHEAVSVDAIFSDDRRKPVSQARQIVCWLAIAEGHKSVHVGKTLGRDHSTVLHAVDKITATPKLLAIARRIQTEMNGAAA